MDFHRSKTQRPASEQLLARRADGELLLAALRRYLTMVTPAEQQEPLSHLRPFYGNGMEPSGPKKETSNSRPVLTAKTQVGTMKDLLTSVDGGFCELLTSLGPVVTVQWWMFYARI